MVAQPAKLHPSHVWGREHSIDPAARCKLCGCHPYIVGGFPTHEAAVECKRRIPYDDLKRALGSIKVPKRPRQLISTHGFEVKKKPRAL